MMKQPAGLAALALVSLGLLYLLLSYGGLTWPGMIQSIAGLGWLALTGTLALTGANLAIGTFKWLLVMHAFERDSKDLPRFADGFLTTTLGALLGQIMPVQFGVALTRSLAGRLGIGRSPAANLGTTAFEQLFDVLVLCVAALISLLGLILHSGPGGWLALVLLLSPFGVFAAMRFKWLLGETAKLLARVSSPTGLCGYISKLSQSVMRAADLSPSIFVLLAALSVLRFAAVLSRAVIVLSALGMSGFTAPLLIAFPLVQTIGIFPLVPGNLGILEWTWSGVLVYAGATISAAVLFAVTMRIVNVMAQLVVLVFLIIARLHPSAWEPQRVANLSIKPKD